MLTLSGVNGRIRSGPTAVPDDLESSLTDRYEDALRPYGSVAVMVTVYVERLMLPPVTTSVLPPSVEMLALL
jgi:hypothetical protein